MVPSKGRTGRGPRAAPAPVNNCGLQLVIQTSSMPDKSKPFEFRINKEPSSFHNRLLQHDLEKNYSGRQDNTNFGSSSSITFPVLQRTAEEKILNSDRLTLERQKLTVCPVIDGEDHLRLLNFQHNFITRIQNISNLHHLVFLDLYDNQIEEISGVSTLRSLRVLLLGKNRIKKISNLENLKNLDVLDLHGNQWRVEMLKRERQASTIGSYCYKCCSKFVAALSNIKQTTCVLCSSRGNLGPDDDNALGILAISKHIHSTVLCGFNLFLIAVVNELCF